MAAAYFTFINAQICSLISYLCVGILCNLYEMCNKTCPVDRCWSIFLKSRNMFCRAIPFIRCKNHIPGIVLSYSTIRRSLVTFCYNTCSRNRCALGISLNDRHLRNFNSRNRNRIIQKKLRHNRKFTYRLSHCLIGCLQNVISSILAGLTIPSPTATASRMITSYSSSLLCAVSFLESFRYRIG